MSRIQEPQTAQCGATGGSGAGVQGEQHEGIRGFEGSGEETRGAGRDGHWVVEPLIFKGWGAWWREMGIYGQRRHWLRQLASPEEAEQRYYDSNLELPLLLLPFSLPKYKGV